MAFLTSMNIVGSGLTAQQLRLDVVSENITAFQNLTLLQAIRRSQQTNATLQFSAGSLLS